MSGAVPVASTDGPAPTSARLLWFVWEADSHGEDEDGSKVYALDAELAAEKWADEQDCYGDYTIIGGSEATVRVTPAEGGEPLWFVVSGEYVPEYSARKIEPPEGRGEG
jgi:hypothetical protein